MCKNYSRGGRSKPPNGSTAEWKMSSAARSGSISASCAGVAGNRAGKETAVTKNVLDHHLKCFNEGDLEGILFDYLPGAVLFTPDGPLRGTDAIRPLFHAMIAEFGKPGATFSMKQLCVEGDYAFILWTAETADNVYELGTDTFVVRNGKIVAQSFTGTITPKAEARMDSGDAI